MGLGFWSGEASQAQHRQVRNGIEKVTWVESLRFQRGHGQVERSNGRKKGLKEEELLRADCALFIQSEVVILEEGELGEMMA